MKIQLPNGEKLTLDNNISLEEKLLLVEDLIKEWDYFTIENFNSLSVIIFYDGLADYLIWHKEEDVKWKEDKEVLSVKKIKQMNGKLKSKSIPFSSLSTEYKEMLGISEVED